MKEGDSVSAHASKFRHLRAQLAALGTTLTETDAVAQFLLSFPPSYQTFVTTQNVPIQIPSQPVPAGQISPTLGAVIGALYQEEQTRLMRGQGQHKNKIDKVFSAWRGRGRGRGRIQSQRPSHSSGQGTNTQKRQGNCNWCGLPGHWARECRKKKAGESQRVPPRPAAANSATQ